MKMKIIEVNMNTTINEYAKILKEWMIKKEYIIVKPQDKSVMFNQEILGFFEPLIYRSDYEEEYIKELERENSVQQKQIENLIRTIEGMQASRTWKVTEPIRKIKKMLNRG